MYNKDESINALKSFNAKAKKLRELSFTDRVFRKNSSGRPIWVAYGN